MIGKGIRYAYPVAVVRALLGNLLRETDYTFLLQAAGSEEMLAYLRSTARGGAIAEDSWRAVSFAIALYEHYLSEAAKIIALFPLTVQELCRAFLLRFEIESLKVILRAAGQQIDATALMLMLRPLPAATALPVDRLAAARSVDEIAEALVGTPFAQPLQEGLGASSSEAAQSLFAVETRLDRWFFTQLFAAAAPLSGRERALVRRLLGSIADVTNILWAQRLRTTYRLSPSETLPFMIPYGFRLDQRKRQALALWDGRQVLPISLPGVRRLAVPLRPLLMGLLRREAFRPLLTIPFQAGVPLAYLLLCEIEVEDLRTIYEGKRWGLAPAQIAERLVFFRGPSIPGAAHV